MQRIDNLSWKWPLVSGAVLLALGIALSQWALRTEQENRRQQYEAINSEIAALLNVELGEASKAMGRMAERWTAANGTPRDQWDSDAAGYVEDFGYFQAVGWADRDYIVRWIMPMAGNESALNFDLGSEARRKATLDEGRATGEMATTPLIDLVQGGKGFIEYFPVYVNGEFDGFISAVFRVEELFDKITESVQETHIVDVYGEDGIIYSSSPGEIGVDEERPYTIHDLTTVGRDWELRVARKGSYARVGTRISVLVLVFSVATTVLVVLLVRYLMLSYARGRLAREREKHIEKLLNEHRQVTDSVPVLIAEFDRYKRYRFANKTYCDWFGFDSTTIIGKRAQDLLGPAFADAEPRMEQALAGTEVSYEVMIPKVGQGMRWVQAKYSPNPGTSEDDAGFFAIVMDVHDARVAEKELARQLRLHESIVNNTSAVVYSKSLDGAYLGANREFERLFKLKRSEAIGRTDHELFPAEFADGFRANDVAVAEQQKTLVVEEVAPHEDGDHYYISTKFPLFDEDGVMFAVAGVSTDITDLKQKSAELEAKSRELGLMNAELTRSNEELDKFAYVASHDLKAPCRAIDNLAKWITEDSMDALSEQSKGDLELLRSRARRMETLLDDLLEFSRAGRETTNVRSVCVLEVIESIVEMLNPKAGMEVVVKGEALTFSTAIAPLRQVMLNLITNAIKHHDRNEGLIEVDWVDKGDVVEFTVCDDGPGIPEEQHGRVFEMFQTLRPRDEVEGSGMGMAIVQKVVIAMGGTIVIESQGRGTVIRVAWPKREQGD